MTTTPSKPDLVALAERVLARSAVVSDEERKIIHDALLASSSLASQSSSYEAGRDEIGWLIEQGDPPVYYTVHQNDYDEHWTHDADKALRFARREDAQAYVDHIGWTSPPVRVVEHMWPAGSVREALDSIEMFFRVLRGPSYVSDAISLNVTNADYKKAREGFDTIKTALSAPVAVKPLEWEQPDGPEGTAWLGHGTDMCQYYIRFDTETASYWMPGDCPRSDDDDSGEEFLSIDAAKAAAQADYEQRIRSALIAYQIRR